MLVGTGGGGARASLRDTHTHEKTDVPQSSERGKADGVRLAFILSFCAVAQFTEGTCGQLRVLAQQCWGSVILSGGKSVRGLIKHV